MNPEDYFILEDLFPDFKILKPQNNQTPASFKALREENIAGKRLVNHGMPMTYEEKTIIIWDYKNGDSDIPSLEAYLQRSYISILHILESEGISVTRSEIEIAYQVTKERRFKEGVDNSIYESSMPNLFDLNALEDFKSWHHSYKLILKGILELKNITIEKELEDFLNSLISADEQLVDSYQNDQIENIYDLESKELAYLLRYSSVYAKDLIMIFEEFELKKNLSSFDKLHLTIVGPGPGFEVLALIQWMIEHNIFLTSKASIFNLIDKNKWKIGRNIIKEEINKNLLVEGLKDKLDIKESCIDFMELEEGQLAKSNILVFQNCLNEILTSYSSELVEKKIKSYLNAAPKDSVLIFIDRDKYKITETFLEKMIQISSLLSFNIESYRWKKNYHPVTQIQIPEILKDTIYNSSLSPTRRVKSTYLVLRKLDN